MARNQATTVENNFVTGLITEKTALSFPENAATDTLNCIFKQQGNVTRRPGLTFEEFSTLEGSSKTETQSYKTYLWEAVAGSGNVSLLVVQAGSTLYFYDTSTNLNTSANRKSFVVHLEDFLPLESTRLPGEYICDFASGNGELIVVNQVCDPFYITYDTATDTILTTRFSVRYRDFDGARDELPDDFRPLATLNQLASNYPNHYYNILNQGWYQADALTQWDTALTTLPSNQDQVPLYRDSESDAFNPTLVTSKSPGNTLAPKGHFILDAANPLRTKAAIEEGFNVSVVSGDLLTKIPQTAGTTLTLGTNTFDLALAACTNGILTSTSASATRNTFLSSNIGLGKAFTTPKRIAKAIWYTTSDFGIKSAAGTYSITLYGKQGTTAPTTITDGVQLAQFTNVTNVASMIVTLNSNDASSLFNYAWVVVADSGAANQNWFCVELEFYTFPDSEERASTVAFLGGRVFYSGFSANESSNKVFFSPVIQSSTQYGNCYQKNDPSNEYYYELLSDDGGVVKILEIGTVVKLFPIRSSIVVFATNGVWIIGGSTGAGFKATDFSVKKISSLGTTSPQSVTDVKGIPVWWAEDGIYTMQYDPNYDSFQIVSLTQNTIKSFFLDIPIENRKYVKGTYDSISEIVYWIYNDTTNFTSTEHYKYNSVLCLNTITKAFYPWKFSITTGEIRDIKYVYDSKRNLLGRLKLLTTVYFSDIIESITFSEFRDYNYLDWGSEDYTSFFTTGYKIHGQTQRFVQPNYVFVFLNDETNSSCYMHTRYDWTNSGDSGKWSSVQQVYNSALTNRDVNFRRLKVRGKGRSMQLHFTSEIGKPFDIIGWSIYETGNSGL